MCHFLAPLGQPKMMHKNFMHEHKSKMGVPPTHEVLYRLQISQHQLQKDVTHQLSRFLVNRRDDEADLSDMVHIFFRSGLFSHGVLLSQMQNKIIALPVVHWESKQANTLAGCWPAAYDLGTKCPKVFLKGGSAASAPVGLS
jgi:hypothetical protein